MFHNHNEKFLVPAMCRCHRALFSIEFEKQDSGLYVATQTVGDSADPLQGSQILEEFGHLSFAAYLGCHYCHQENLVLCAHCHVLSCCKPNAWFSLCPRCFHFGLISGHFHSLHGSPSQNSSGGELHSARGGRFLS
jgi:hypothetical protein